MNAAAPILEFNEVESGVAGGYDVGLQSTSFALMPGMCLSVLVPGDEEFQIPLPDLACGMADPTQGTVRFLGERWESLHPQAASIQRFKIGRIYSHTPWMSNLDLDEGITLACRYHRKRSQAELEQNAEALCRRLGLPELPRDRPAWTARRTLALCQWVRCLIREPALILLEYPETGLGPEDLAVCRSVLAEKLAAGAACIWITQRREEWKFNVCRDMMHLTLTQDRLVRSDG